MTSGRWEPSAYRGAAGRRRHPSRALTVVGAGSPFGPRSEAPRSIPEPVRSPAAGRPTGCVWWLFLAAAVALPVAVLAVSLAAKAFGP